MTPERLGKDPIVRTVEDLDRARRWLVVVVVLLAALVVAVVALGAAYFDLAGYVKQPAGRDNRIEFQCQMQQALGVEEVDCDR